MVVIVPPQHHRPSKRALALSKRLESAIADFRAEEPKLTDAEVRSAIEHVRSRATGRPAAAVTAVIATCAGLLVALGIAIAASVASDGGVEARPALVWPLLAGAAAVIVTLGVVLARKWE